MKIEDMYAMWMKDAHDMLWKRALKARQGFDCMKDKETPYAKAMLALAVKYAEAAELFEMAEVATPPQESKP